jgi:hypothetical protein
LLDLLQVKHDAFQQLALAAELLRALYILPDGGIFRERDDFGQTFLLLIEVKDTSVIPDCERASPAGNG